MFNAPLFHLLMAKYRIKSLERDCKHYYYIIRGVEKMVELDQIKYELTDRVQNLNELGESL